MHLSPFAIMRPPCYSGIVALADARASKTSCAIGGFVSHPQRGQLWFSETFHRSDFLPFGVPIHAEMQRDISCYEALAQGALILTASALASGCRIPILLKSQSDNTAAEAGSNSLFSTSRPLAFFLERLALLFLRITG